MKKKPKFKKTCCFCGLKKMECKCQKALIPGLYPYISSKEREALQEEMNKFRNQRIDNMRLAMSGCIIPHTKAAQMLAAKIKPKKLTLKIFKEIH